MHRTLLAIRPPERAPLPNGANGAVERSTLIVLSVGGGGIGSHPPEPHRYQTVLTVASGIRRSSSSRPGEEGLAAILRNPTVTNPSYRCSCSLVPPCPPRTRRRNCPPSSRP